MSHTWTHGHTLTRRWANLCLLGLKFTLSLPAVSLHIFPRFPLSSRSLCAAFLVEQHVTFSVSRHRSVCLCDCVLTHRLWRSVFFSGSKAWIMFYFQLVIMAGTVLLAYYFEYTDTFPVHVQGFFCFDKTFSKPYPGPDETSNVPPVLVYSLVAAIPTITVSSPSFLCVLVGIVRLNFSLGDKLSSFIIWIYVHVMWFCVCVWERIQISQILTRASVGHVSHQN